MKEGTDDLYALLEADPGFSAEQLKQRFHSLALQLHPDKNSGDNRAAERFAAVNEAWAVLGDPKSRAAYDASSKATAEPDRVSEDVDLDDMRFVEETEEYEWDCRCGDCYSISVIELEECAEVVGCGGCET